LGARGKRLRKAGGLRKRGKGGSVRKKVNLTCKESKQEFQSKNILKAVKGGDVSCSLCETWL
jgi:hypothetical protein